MDNSGLLKIIIFLLLVIVFGSVVIWIAAAILGMYAIIFGIGITIFAVAGAVTYIVKNNWHIKFNDLVSQALSVFRESAVGRAIVPYAKWLMYASELFFALNIFADIRIGGGIPTLFSWIFILSLIVIYAFNDNKHLFCGSIIYAVIDLFAVVFFSINSKIFIFSYTPNTMLFISRLIIFGAIAYFAKRRMRKRDTDDNAEFNETRKPANKLLAAAPFVLIALIFTVNAVSYAVSPQTRFNRAIDTGSIAQAVELYEKTSDSTSQKANLEKLNALVTDAADRYINGESNYEDALISLEAIWNVSDLQKDITDAMERMNKIKTSRDAFNSAVESENGGDLITALAEYGKVIADDKNNYAAAKDKIEQIKPKIKELAFEEIKQYIENDDYVSARKVVDNVLITLPNDAELLNIKKDIDPQVKAILLSAANVMVADDDFDGAKTVIDEALELFAGDKEFSTLKITIDNTLRILQTEKTKAEQLVFVESAEVVVQNESVKTLYPDLADIRIKNTSDKTVANYTVAYRGKDKTNYLIEIKTKNDGTAELTKTVSVEGANVGAGEAYQDQSVEFAADIKVVGISACVVSVEFADGATWENPYYEFWNTDLSGYAGSRVPKATSKPSSSSSNSSSSSKSSNGSSSSNPYGYGTPKPGESPSDYIKREDPQLYKDMEKRWNSLR